MMGDFFVEQASGVSDDQLPKGLTVEEIFKLAVGEMTLWLSSC